MKRAILKPTEGGLVRHPTTMRPLAADGEEVSLTRFWRRRISAGDVVVVESVEPKAQRRGRSSKNTSTEG